MSSESPPVWTILPPCSSMAGSIRVLTENAEPFERSYVIQANQAAVTNHVGIDDGYQLPPICRPTIWLRWVRYGHRARSRELRRRLMAPALLAAARITP